MATPKSGNLIKLYLSIPDGGWKTVVCKEDLSIEGTAEEITRSTSCGVFKDAGNLSYTISFSGMADFAPGTDLVSQAELATWFNTKTKLYFVFGDGNNDLDPATIMLQSGECYITAFNITATVDDFVSFDATLSVTGNLSVII